MEKVKVLITNEQKAVKIPTGIRLLIRRCCHASLLSEGVRNDTEISVTFVDNARIRELNAEYRNIDRETDVLSFPMYEPQELRTIEESQPLALGDIVISVEKAMEQAQSYGHTIEREIAFLTVHSMFHLLGYDHVDGGLQAVQMREKEEGVLTKLGLQRDTNYVM